MKKIFSFFITAFMCLMIVKAETASVMDNEKDHTRLMDAVSLYDNKDYEEALVILDSLVSEYPNDYVVGYERGLTLYRLEKYDSAIEEMERLSKLDHTKADVYQLWGNSLDMLKKPNEAIKIYKEGLEKFPDAGSLYLEIGNVYNLYGKKDLAISYYNCGILKDPDFASNYFRGALYYFESEEKIWGLIYAEAEILLKPNDEDRKNAMAEEMLDCYAKCISINEKDSVIGVTMTSESMMFIKDGDEIYLNAPNMLELCYAVAAGETVWDKEMFNPNDFQSVVQLRERMVRTYFKLLDNYFGNNLYLLEFQKKVIDAGHWEAYNYFLFSDVLTYGCEMWRAENPDAVDNFIEWYNSGNLFELSDERRVEMNTIYVGIKPYTMESYVSKAIDIRNFLKNVKL